MRSTPTPSTGWASTTTATCATTFAISYVYSQPKGGAQTFDVFLATGDEARSIEALGEKVVDGAGVSFGTDPNIVTGRRPHFFAGVRSDAFFFDFDGIKGLFDTSGGRNFTAPHLGGESPWTDKDSNTEANIFSMVMELPTGDLGADPEGPDLGRCSLRKDDGVLLHVDRAGHPSVSSFFNTDETKLEYNASEPESTTAPGGRTSFVHLMGHTVATAGRRRSPPSTRTAYCPTCSPTTRPSPPPTPTGASSPTTFINHRLAFLSKGDIPPTGSPRTPTRWHVPLSRHAAPGLLNPARRGCARWWAAIAGSCLED